jgi:hypothetical protein
MHLKQTLTIPYDSGLALFSVFHRFGILAQTTGFFMLAFHMAPFLCHRSGTFRPHGLQLYLLLESAKEIHYVLHGVLGVSMGLGIRDIPNQG